MRLALLDIIDIFVWSKHSVRKRTRPEGPTINGNAITTISVRTRRLRDDLANKNTRRWPQSSQENVETGVVFPNPFECHSRNTWLRCDDETTDPYFIPWTMCLRSVKLHVLNLLTLYNPASHKLTEICYLSRCSV